MAESSGFCQWSWKQDSNLQPTAYKAVALPLRHSSEYHLICPAVRTTCAFV